MSPTTTQQPSPSPAPIPYDNLETLFDRAAAERPTLTPPDGFNGGPVVVLPRGYTAAPVAGWEPDKPNRVKDTASFASVESFVRYWQEFRLPESILCVEVTDTQVRFCAVFDYHGGQSSRSGEPGWCQHRAVYAPRITTEWARWAKANGNAMTQAQFAQYLEDNVDTIRSPSGADLLQLVNTIEVAGAVTFQSAQRLENGSVRLQYVNEQKAKSGDLEFPGSFELLVPVFEDDAAVPIKARLRYRLKGSEFFLWFEIPNVHRIIRAASEEILKRVATGCAVTPYRIAPTAIER